MRYTTLICTQYFFTYTWTDIWFLVKDRISKEEGQKKCLPKTFDEKNFNFILSQSNRRMIISMKFLTV